MEDIAISIYALVDPRTEAGWYVGAAMDALARLRQHYSPSTNYRLIAWVRDLKDAGLKPDMAILEVVPHTRQVQAEFDAIQGFKRNGLLVNRSMLNPKTDIETRQRALNRDYQRKYARVVSGWTAV